MKQCARGAVLILCVLLLMALSLLGLAALADSQLQHRSSAHGRVQLYQAAAARVTLAWAEAWLMSLEGTARPLPCAHDCASRDIVRPAGFHGPQPELEDVTWWRDNGMPVGLDPTRGVTHPVPALAPGVNTRWMVEELRWVPSDDEGVDGHAWYRILARVASDSANPAVMVEGITARPWGGDIEADPLPPMPDRYAMCLQRRDLHPCGRQAWQRLR